MRFIVVKYITIFRITSNDGATQSQRGNTTTKKEDNKVANTFNISNSPSVLGRGAKPDYYQVITCSYMYVLEMLDMSFLHKILHVRLSY